MAEEANARFLGLRGGGSGGPSDYYGSRGVAGEGRHGGVEKKKEGKTWRRGLLPLFHHHHLAATFPTTFEPGSEFYLLLRSQFPLVGIGSKAVRKQRTLFNRAKSNLFRTTIHTIKTLFPYSLKFNFSQFLEYSLVRLFMGIVSAHVNT